MKICTLDCVLQVIQKINVEPKQLRCDEVALDTYSPYYEWIRCRNLFQCFFYENACVSILRQECVFANQCECIN